MFSAADMDYDRWLASLCLWEKNKKTYHTTHSGDTAVDSGGMWAVCASDVNVEIVGLRTCLRSRYRTEWV